MVLDYEQRYLRMANVLHGVGNCVVCGRYKKVWPNNQPDGRTKIPSGTFARWRDTPNDYTVHAICHKMIFVPAEKWGECAKQTWTCQERGCRKMFNLGKICWWCFTPKPENAAHWSK